MPALQPPPTLGAAAYLDVEPPHEGLNRRQLFLILRRHTVHGDRAAAVGTTRRDRRRVDLVDAWGRLAPPLLPVVRAAASPRPLAASLPPVLGEGAGLPLAGAPGGLELLLQLLAAALPVVAFPRSASPCLASGARCAGREGLADARSGPTRPGRPSCAPCLTYRHKASTPAHIFVDFLAPTR